MAMELQRKANLIAFINLYIPANIEYNGISSNRNGKYVNILGDNLCIKLFQMDLVI